MGVADADSGPFQLTESRTGRSKLWSPAAIFGVVGWVGPGWVWLARLTNLLLGVVCAGPLLLPHRRLLSLDRSLVSRSQTLAGRVWLRETNRSPEDETPNFRSLYV